MSEHPAAYCTVKAGKGTCMPSSAEQNEIHSYLAEVIDSANEGIYVTDRDRRFLLWNEAAERISGYRKEELISRRCYDNILSHVDREGNPLCSGHCPLLASIEDGAPGGPVVVYLKHKNGKRIAVEVKTAPIRNRAGTIIGGVEIFQDVTERVEREQLLEERRVKLETVLDHIQDGILFLNTEGKIAMFNRACAGLFGLDSTAITPISTRSPAACRSDRSCATRKKSASYLSPMGRYGCRPANVPEALKPFPVLDGRARSRDTRATIRVLFLCSLPYGPGTPGKTEGGCPGRPRLFHDFVVR